MFSERLRKSRQTILNHFKFCSHQFPCTLNPVEYLCHLTHWSVCSSSSISNQFDIAFQVSAFFYTCCKCSRRNVSRISHCVCCPLHSVTCVFHHDLELFSFYSKTLYFCLSIIHS